MMTPDSRPIGVLTPAILATASHWCIRWGDNALTVPAREVTIFSTVIDAYGLTFGSGSESKTTCYPCTLQPNGLIVPEPWPVLDGEEEIQEWRGMSCKFDAQVTSNWGHTYWALFTHMNEETAYETELRPSMRPAPRKGKSGPVWVWEKDRC